MADYMPEPKKGDDSRELWRHVRELLRITKRQDSELRRLSSGVTDLRLGNNFKEGGGGGGKVTFFRVLEVRADYNVCDKLDGSPPIAIARPWRLRRSPFDGQSIDFIDERGRPYTATYTYQTHTRRTVRILTLEESQVIVPRYKPEFDWIAAVECENTRVKIENTETPVTWIELSDGRAWARER